jgi:hypothetical protein
MFSMAIVRSKSWIGLVACLLTQSACSVAESNDGEQATSSLTGGESEVTDEETLEGSVASTNGDEDIDDEDSSFESTEEQDPCEDPLDDGGEIRPISGSTVRLAYNPLRVTWQAPRARPECPSDAKVKVAISAARVPGIPESIFSEVVAQGENIEAFLDLSLFASGDEIEIDYSAQIVGGMYGQGALYSIFFDGERDSVEVVSCMAFASQLGAALDIRCEGFAPGGPESLTTWTLEGGPQDAQIDSGGRNMTIEDVKEHAYAVSVADFVSSSAPQAFRIPVDTHRSQLKLDSGDVERLGADNASMSRQPFDAEWTAHVPETIADRLSQACALFFDAEQKPSQASQSPYIVEIDSVCASGIIESMTTDDFELLDHYPVTGGGESYRTSVSEAFRSQHSVASITNLEYYSDQNE